MKPYDAAAIKPLYESMTNAAPVSQQHDSPAVESSATIMDVLSGNKQRKHKGSTKQQSHNETAAVTASPPSTSPSPPPATANINHSTATPHSTPPSLGCNATWPQIQPFLTATATPNHNNNAQRHDEAQPLVHSNRVFGSTLLHAARGIVCQTIPPHQHISIVTLFGDA